MTKTSPTHPSPPGPALGLAAAAWLCVLGLALAPRPAYAEGFSFTVSPLLIELQGPPGSTQKFDIAVMSADVARPAEFEVSVTPIVQDLSGNYRVAPAGAKSERSAAEWIKVSPQSFRLEPGESRLLQGELTFPRQFRGGAYAGVVLSLKPEEGAAEGPRQVIRNEFVVAVESVAVTTGVRPDVYISSLSVLSTGQKGLEAYAQAYGPRALIFTGELVNEGNVHAFASGTISLWDAQGRKLNQFPLGTGRGAILPASTVRMGSVLTNGLPPGEYTLQAVVNYGGARPAVTRQKFVVGDTLLQQAQGGHGVRVVADPEVLSFELAPGASKFVALRVQNFDKVPVRVSAQVLPLVYDAAGSPNVEAVEAEGSSAAWTLLRPQEVTIAPGTARNLQVGVRVPRDAPAGGHYAQVMLSARPEGGQAGGPETELSVPLYVVLGKDLPAEGELAPVGVQESDDGRFLILSTVFTNRGKVHVTPSAEVVVELKTAPQASGDAEFVGEPIWVESMRLNVPPAATPVLPGGARNLGALVQKPDRAGEYRVRVIVRFGGTGALVQQAQVTITQGAAQGTAQAASPGGPGP